MALAGVALDIMNGTFDHQKLGNSSDMFGLVNVSHEGSIEGDAGGTADESKLAETFQDYMEALISQSQDDGGRSEPEAMDNVNMEDLNPQLTTEKPDVMEIASSGLLPLDMYVMDMGSQPESPRADQDVDTQVYNNVLPEKTGSGIVRKGQPNRTNGGLESMVQSTKEKPRRATSNLRKLQNKLSQQRFRQRKRHAEAEQQSELDRMMSKIEALEAAKNELPALQLETEEMQAALKLKQNECALLKQQISAAKKAREGENNSSQEAVKEGVDEEENEEEVRSRVLEVTALEYETMVAALKNIYSEYDDGFPGDDDMAAQRKIALVLEKFVDMTYDHSMKPCVKSLMAASLAYLSKQGLDEEATPKLVQEVDALALTSAQAMEIIASRRTFLSQMDLVLQSRKKLNTTIQRKFADSLADGSSNKKTPDLVCAIDDLKGNLLCECRLRQEFQVTSFRLLHPIQIMKIILATDPHFPDFVVYANGIALQDKWDEDISQ